MRRALLLLAVLPCLLSCAAGQAEPPQVRSDSGATVYAKIISAKGKSAVAEPGTPLELGLSVLSGNSREARTMSLECRGLGGPASVDLSRDGTVFSFDLPDRPIVIDVALRDGKLPERISLTSRKGRAQVLSLDFASRYRARLRYGLDGPTIVPAGASLRLPGDGGFSFSLPLGDFPRGALNASIRSVKPLSISLGKSAAFDLAPGSTSLPLDPRSTAAFAVSGKIPADGFEIEVVEAPDGPIPTDPLFILSWKKASFRFGDLELFSWDRHPEVLILRFATLAAQDRYLKRIAFFVEKAGFRGRLARDEEIAGLHGWNAHDYESPDLARFFEQARSQGFPLNPDELALRDMLIAAGELIKSADGSIGPVFEKALISTCIESGPVMERRFMAHEGYHGLFFVSKEFQAAAETEYQGLDPELKGYIEEFFDYKDFDTSYRRMMVNEFAAYFLQQEVKDAPEYFGVTVARFLEEDRGGSGAYLKRGKSLMDKISRTAESYDRMAATVAGLRAGSVWAARESSQRP